MVLQKAQTSVVSLLLVEKFIDGVVDTGEQFLGGVVDTGEQSTTPRINFSTVSMTPSNSEFCQY
jgi:hypothetical protein